MERGLSLLIAAVMLFVAPGVRAADNFSFANNTAVNITLMGCGVSKLCIQTQGDCDPAGNSSCLFASVAAGNSTASNGTELIFQLSGNSTGYIALGLTVNATQGTTALFICAQNSSNNASFIFGAQQRNNTNNMLSRVSPTVTKIRGQVVSGKIQCEFNVPNLNATNTRSADSTTFVVLLGSGPLSGSDFGNFTVSLTTGPLNLADPRANLVNTNTTTNTTTAPSTNTTQTTSGAPHTQGLTLLLTFLMLCLLKTA